MLDCVFELVRDSDEDFEALGLPVPLLLAVTVGDRIEDTDCVLEPDGVGDVVGERVAVGLCVLD